MRSEKRKDDNADAIELQIIPEWVMEPSAEYTDRSKALLNRLKAFALRIIRLYTGLPKSTEAQVLGRQVLRSGTSPGAQYSEARRAKSRADYISKLGGALQELEETAYWLDLLAMAEILPADRLTDLADECEQLIRLFATTLKNTRADSQGP